MRIVGGKYKGRKLNEFAGASVRPTSDMVRESLFNILQFKIQDKTFLDLFCGTGAVGIEALSRGAKSVTFNDLKRDSVNLTKSNLQKLGIVDGFKITNADALTFYKTCADKFDYVFLDPPYADGMPSDALENLATILTDDGVIIYENQTFFRGQPEGLKIVDERKYGKAHLTFFQKGDN